MKAALCRSLEGPNAVALADIAPPTFRPDGEQVLVSIACAGLNHSDLLRTLGRYQEKAPLPFSPGGEIAGIVEAAPVGSEFKPGDRVMAYLSHGGARALQLVEPWRLVPIPVGVSDHIAAGLAITYGTALHALRSRLRLEPGQCVVVLGAGGGAGLAAVECARSIGARVLAVASRDKHAVCLARGADAVVDRDTPDLKRALRDLSGPGGPDCIYDCVGGDQAEPALRALRSGGSYLVVGFASRKVPVLPLDIVLVKELSVIGINWPAAVARDPAAYRADLTFALGAVLDGRLNPVIYKVYPLEHISVALGVLDRGEAVGKVLVTTR